MSDLEDQISRVLNDPEQMSRITALAQSLMGEGQAAPASSPEGAETGPGPDLLAGLGRLLAAPAGGGGDQAALLAAMKPWLSATRKQKLGRAMQLARIAKLARRAMGEASETHV